MQIDFKRVGEVVVLKATGTPEELACYTKLTELHASVERTKAVDAAPHHFEVRSGNMPFFKTVDIDSSQDGMGTFDHNTFGHLR